MKLDQFVMRGFASVVFVLGCVLCNVATAANNVPANATEAPIDNAWVDSFIAPTIFQRYYRAVFAPGRSYCVEVQPNVNSIDEGFDSASYVFANDTATSVLFSNDDWNQEPWAGHFSKNCFIWAQPASSALLNVQQCCGRPAVTPGGNLYFRFRIVSTTLYGPWFFVDTASSYNAFIEVGNTTGDAVNITVTIRGQNGAPIGTPQSRLLFGGGNIAFNARTDFGVTLTSGAGSVQVAHDGAPGAISGNVTSLSGLTGISFDAPLSRRQNW